MPEFLVERYVPHVDGATLATIVARLKHATAELAAIGYEVRWLRSVVVLEDETCLCLFYAARPDDVAAVNERAGVQYERIVRVLSAGGAAQ